MMRKRARVTSASGGSRGGSSSSSRAVVETRGVEDWLDKVLRVAPAPPPPASWRGPKTPAPPAPMSVRELYDGRFDVIRATKWREQLLDRGEHRRTSATDVAQMVLALEEGALSDMLVFSSGKETTSFVAKESGIWYEVNGTDHHHVYQALTDLTERMDCHVIDNLREMVRRLRVKMASVTEGGREGDPEETARALRDAEDHLREVAVLYERIRTPSFAVGVVKRIITERFSRTEESGLKMRMMDTAKGCLAFSDGVYSFKDKRLVTGTAARAYYQTQTVEYGFEATVEALGGENELELPPREVVESTAVWRAYDAFVKQIFSASPEVRVYLMDLLASSALNENRQIMAIHYNIRGSNGKSTLFSLISKAFGGLYIKCLSSVMASTTNPASGPNEELASVKGKRVALFSEPSTKFKLSASFIKELTGGDEQSARGLYKKKETFVYSGMAHVLCNKIPEIDDMEGGIRRRLRCIPYGSTFTDSRTLKKIKKGRDRGLPDAELDHRDNAYLVDEHVMDHFEAWKHCLIWEVMERAAYRYETRQSGGKIDLHPPKVVKDATRDLIERESTVEAFIERMLSRSNRRSDYVTLKHAYDQYVKYVDDRNDRTGDSKVAEKKSDFKLELLAKMGNFAASSGALKNYWRGWKLQEVFGASSDEDDDSDAEEEYETEEGEDIF
jgi:hypothetical protein